MSADNWAACPRCKASGTASLRGNDFREDWELGLNDPEAWGADEEGKSPAVVFNYTGQCQTCGLKVTIRERFPVTWDEPTPEPTPEPNRPTGFVVRKPWGQIPAGWFVQAPGGTWYEVVTTRAMHSDLQLVTIRPRDGGAEVETRRPQDERVPCRRGTASAVGWLDSLTKTFPDTRIMGDQIS